MQLKRRQISGKMGATSDKNAKRSAVYLRPEDVDRRRGLGGQFEAKEPAEPKPVGLRLLGNATDSSASSIQNGRWSGLFLPDLRAYPFTICDETFTNRVLAS